MFSAPKDPGNCILGGFKERKKQQLKRLFAFAMDGRVGYEYLFI